MNKRIKFLISAVLIFALFVSSFILPASSYETGVETSTADMLLVNLDTDTVVFSQKPDNMWYAGYLSELTSERFAAMVDGMEVDTIKQIVGRLNGAGHEEAVRMMQAMFLISGMEYAAEDLDILSFIEDFDECVYDFFINDIFSMDFFDWFLTEMCLEKAYKPACLPPILS